ncbi:MAG TPA: serine protease [Casimicrobiaceae bacterium]|nr:serine protease [Casimicrobiaceae bacterium]
MISLSRARSALLRMGSSAFISLVLSAALPAHADRMATIDRVKGSVVAVGTFVRTRSPQFQFLGTGFAVDDGTLIVTNAHVIPAMIDPAKMEVLAVLIPGPTKDGSAQAQVREAKQIAVDVGSDVGVLKMSGATLPALKLRDSDTVKVGQEIFFTGYPIGAVLGPYPATHRGMISAITPIAIPQARAGDLDANTLRRLASGAFPVFQLDATAYPGNSGSPLYDPDTGEVLGIVNMVFVKGTKEAILTQPSGITYAVPSSHLEQLLKKLR